MAGFENLTPLVLVWIAAVIVLAGFVQGALGLGFPIVATPLIAMATDIRTAVIVVLLPCAATIALVMARAPLLLDTLRRFWGMPVAAFFGAAVGMVFGTAAGVSEGTANVAAPPLVIYYLALGLPPVMLVQALNICFLT